MIIDFHTHTFPDKIAEKAVAKLRSASHSDNFSDGTASGLARSIKKSGIDLSVVLPVATNPLKVESINDFSAAENGKDGLIYFGCMHPDFEGWKNEIPRIASMGLKGIKLHPVYQGVDFDDIKMLNILDRCAEYSLTVVTHSGWDIGFPGVDHCSPEMVLNAINKVGEMKLVLAHMGGWKYWDKVKELLAGKAYIDTSFSLGEIQSSENYYDENERKMLSPDEFVSLVRAFGSDKVLFGTDSPWADQSGSVQQIENLDLSQEEKDNIFFKNAETILSI